MSAKSDFLQHAWEVPEPYEIFRDEELGIAILPTIKPVKPGHVLVISNKRSWSEMSPRDTANLFIAGQLVCEQLVVAFKAKRGTELKRLGNESPTPHLHCFPRDEATDGGDMYPGTQLQRASNDQLRQTHDIMVVQLEKIGFAQELQRRLATLSN
ncbi:MAG TPA: HIT domain-containing protein [Candidatus Saccharimonadales bacterium]|nr:HIT domain-containing protein [Candidatus Saccharimonadales bacterium]